MKALADFIAPNGKPIYGATAAVARHLGIGFNYVKRIANGTWLAPHPLKARIQEMIRAGITLAPLPRRKKIITAKSSTGKVFIGQLARRKEKS